MMLKNLNTYNSDTRAKQHYVPFSSLYVSLPCLEDWHNEPRTSNGVYRQKYNNEYKQKRKAA